MRFLSLSAMAVAASLALGVGAKVTARQTGSLPAVTIRGNAFYADDDRFYIRGVAYQPGGAANAADPLLDLDGLRRDIERFEELGINTIRVYTIDNSQNHDEAMRMLDDAGIYLALDANTPEYSLNRANLASLHASYNEVYLQSVFATIDAFAGYNNLLLFISANEVINARNNTNAAPYVKAVTRDMKRYIARHADRSIPVGYAAADVAENIQQQAQYFACGEDDWARSDFFAFNDYSWCDPSSFETSGWNAKVETYSNYSLPVFLGEYGCIRNTRQWNEVETLYSTNMSSVYSGGLAYEYTFEPNGYGLVELSGGRLETNDDFDRLRDALQAVEDPSGDGGARTEVEHPECPSEGREWEVNTDRLPEMPREAQQYFDDGAGTGPGLDGEGSQWAGTPSETNPDLSDGVNTSEDVENSGGSSSSGSGNGGSSSGSGGAGDSDEEGAAVSTFGSVSLAASLASVLAAAVLVS